MVHLFRRKRKPNMRNDSRPRFIQNREGISGRNRFIIVIPSRTVVLEIRFLARNRGVGPLLLTRSGSVHKLLPLLIRTNNSTRPSLFIVAFPTSIILRFYGRNLAARERDSFPMIHSNRFHNNLIKIAQLSTKEAFNKDKKLRLFA